MLRFFALIAVGLVFGFCSLSSIQNQTIEFSKQYLSDGFDFPVGKPNAEGYYNAQSFGEKSVN